MIKLFAVIPLISYSLIIFLSISVFMLFRPFPYVDNDRSYILCYTNRVRYEITPNLIFAVDSQLDNFNDSKARKLCAYQIISDYNNVYPTPKEKNYTFLFAKTTQSSWPNALFAAFLVYLSGLVLVRSLGILRHPPNKKYFLISLIFGFIIYFFFIKDPANKLFCKRQADFKLYNFLKAVKKNSAPEKIELNEEVKKFVSNLYNDCIKHEFLQK